MDYFKAPRGRPDLQNDRVPTPSKIYKLYRPPNRSHVYTTTARMIFGGMVRPGHGRAMAGPWGGHGPTMARPCPRQSGPDWRGRPTGQIDPARLSPDCLQVPRTRSWTANGGQCCDAGGLLEGRDPAIAKQLGFGTSPCPIATKKLQTNRFSFKKLRFAPFVAQKPMCVVIS